jgi:orotate phosphoribosyltransferase
MEANSLVEGQFARGKRVVVFDDVVSHFDSKELALRQLALELVHRGITGVEVEGVAVLVNRGSGADARAEAFGTRLSWLAVLHEG